LSFQVCLSVITGKRDLDKVFLDLEGNQIIIVKTRGSFPHAGFVLVPVVARFHDLRLDGGQENVEGLDSVLVRRMRVIKSDLFQ